MSACTAKARPGAKGAGDGLAMPLVMRALLPVLLVALAPSAPAGASPYADALIEGVPHVQQKPDFCGEADAEM